MKHYQSPDDLSLAQEMTRLAPVEVKAFFTFDHAVKRMDGEIPPKVSFRVLANFDLSPNFQSGD